MRDKISEVLEEYLENASVPMGGVYYGILTEELDTWNYFVFNRVNASIKENASGNEYYDVHIVHENYIPDGYEYEIMKAIRDKTKMRPVLSNAFEYNYTRKQNTNIAVEICTIHMVKALKASVMR